jgi:UDP-glucose 4-epimerase
LVRRLACALERRTRLWSLPEPVLTLAAGALGKSAEARRLLGSLTVDDRLIRQELEWNPPFTVDEGLAETAVWFRATRS